MHFTVSVAAAVLSFTLAAAQYEDYLYESSLYAREPFDDDLDLYTREAAFDDEYLFARDAFADPDADAKLEELLDYLYARDALADPDAEPVGKNPGNIVEGVLGAYNKKQEWDESKEMGERLKNQKKFPTPVTKPLTKKKSGDKMNIKKESVMDKVKAKPKGGSKTPVTDALKKKSSK